LLGAVLFGASVLLRARGLDSACPFAAPAGSRLLVALRQRGRWCWVLQETTETEEIIERVAALDIGKAELTCCVRVPQEGRPGRRLQEVESYSTMTRSLLRLADRLRCLGVTRVVMEATSDYWKPVVRHEALFDRAGVRGLRRRAVAAA
jgi:hypothetical protein